MDSKVKATENSGRNPSKQPAENGEGLPLFLRWLSPHVVIFLIFAVGIFLLLSASIPAQSWRLRFLEMLVPLEVVEASHFATSLIGLLLIFLARGLQKRLDSAWLLSVVLLAFSAVLELLKGWHYEEALVLGFLCFVLFRSRQFFRRRGSLRIEYFSLEGFFLTAVLLLALMGLGLFFFRHVEYTDELWWRFEINNDAPRFLRASIGAFILLLILTATRFLRPEATRFRVPGERDMEDARRIIAESGRCSAWLAMLGDKTLLFNSKRTAFLMYRVIGRSWITLGDPVGPAAEWKELIMEFRRAADLHDGWAVFHEASLQGLPVYLDAGFQILKIGEEARVDLETLFPDAPILKELTHARKKVEDKGCSFQMLYPPHLPSLFGELRAVSDEWLRIKRTREKKFSLGYFDERYLAHFPIGVVRSNGRVVAFMNVCASPHLREFTADLMRYVPDKSRSGIMDYLFLNLLVWGHSEGYRWFNMGMAPLSGLEENEFSPLWHRLGNLVYLHGENFYNFRGLRAFKEKFGPVWESKYLVSPGGPATPRILAHISALTSGGWMGILSK